MGRHDGAVSKPSIGFLGLIVGLSELHDCGSNAFKIKSSHTADLLVDVSPGIDNVSSHSNGANGSNADSVAPASSSFVVIVAEDGTELNPHEGNDGEPEEAMKTTDLLFACKNGDLECVKFMLANGADVQAESSMGQTPFDIVRFFSC